MNRELWEHQAVALDNLRQSNGQREIIAGGRRFRQIEGFPRYMVSENGDVFSRIRATRFLRACLNPAGYPYVSLMEDDAGAKGIKICVHILVARAFIPNPLDLPCVNHKNGIKVDVFYKNLEWSTYSANNIHAMDTGLNWNVGATHYAAKIDEDTVRYVRALVASGLMHQEVADRFGLKRKHVTKIVNRKIWARVP